MIDIDTLEALVGPLPKGRMVERAHVSTYRSALTGLPRIFEPPAAEFRAALAEAYERLRGVADEKDRCVDLIRDYEQASLKGANHATKLAAEYIVKRAKQMEAERDEARFFADGWHKQFRRVNRARHEEKARAKQAKAEARKLRKERDDYRQCIAAGMAGCDVPAHLSGDVTDTGDCSKCRPGLPDHCLEYQTLVRYDAEHGGSR